MGLSGCEIVTFSRFDTIPECHEQTNGRTTNGIVVPISSVVFMPACRTFTSKILCIFVTGGAYQGVRTRGCVRTLRPLFVYDTVYRRSSSLHKYPIIFLKITWFSSDFRRTVYPPRPRTTFGATTYIEIAKYLHTFAHVHFRP